MPEIPDNMIHWFLGGMVPAGGALFLFLLKRTFHEFEAKIATLFGQLEQSLQLTQDHETRLAVLEDARGRGRPKRKR
jgi:hypothetical protein